MELSIEDGEIVIKSFSLSNWCEAKNDEGGQTTSGNATTNSYSLLR